MDCKGLVGHFKDLAFIWSGMGSDWKVLSREATSSLPLWPKGDKGRWAE